MLNSIRVHFIGTVLGKGQRGFGGYRSGKIVRVQDSLDAELRLKHDDTEILLAGFLTPDFLPLLTGLRGIILEESSYLSPEQIQEHNPRNRRHCQRPQCNDAVRRRIHRDAPRR